MRPRCRRRPRAPCPRRQSIPPQPTSVWGPVGTVAVICSMASAELRSTGRSPASPTPTTVSARGAPFHARRVWRQRPVRAFGPCDVRASPRFFPCTVFSAVVLLAYWLRQLAWGRPPAPPPTDRIGTTTTALENPWPDDAPTSPSATGLVAGAVFAVVAAVVAAEFYRRRRRRKSPPGDRSLCSGDGSPVEGCVSPGLRHRAATRARTLPRSPMASTGYTPPRLTEGGGGQAAPFYEEIAKALEHRLPFGDAT